MMASATPLPYGKTTFGPKVHKLKFVYDGTVALLMMYCTCHYWHLHRYLIFYTVTADCLCSCNSDPVGCHSSGYKCASSGHCGSPNMEQLEHHFHRESCICQSIVAKAYVTTEPCEARESSEAGNLTRSKDTSKISISIWGDQYTLGTNGIDQ